MTTASLKNARRSFMAAICDAPADDTPRLVFADWLEEHAGHDDDHRWDAAYAEFIRLQVRLANGSADPPLKQRELELCRPAYFWDWFDNVLLRAYPGSPRLVLRPDWTAEVGYSDRGVNWLMTIRRGFMDSLKLPLVAFHRHGRFLVRSQPLSLVEISDLHPSTREYGGGDDRTTYYRRSLPPWLWDALCPGNDYDDAYVEYWSHDIARTRMSAALLKWARTEAGRQEKAEARP